MLRNLYLVDEYAKTESKNLVYKINNQSKLRANNYIHLQVALRVNEHIKDIDQMVILLSSFTGGPKYLHERT